MGADPLQELADADITIAWTHDMEFSVLWLPDERVVVLNAQIPRSDLAADVEALVDGALCDDPPS